MTDLSIFDENGKLRPAREVEQIQFLRFLDENPRIVDWLADARNYRTDTPNNTSERRYEK